MVFLAVFSSLKHKEDTFAYNPLANTNLTKCDLGIIPIGSAAYGTVDALNKIYQLYRGEESGSVGLAGHLDNLIKDVGEFVATLSTIQPEVCDYTKCKAASKETLMDIGAEVRIEECLIAGQVCDTAETICFSACRQFECKGDPCLSASVEDALKSFEISKNQIDGDYMEIKKFYQSSDQPITKDIEKSTDPAKGFITTLEFLKRRLTAAAEMVMPYSGKGPLTCMPNESERKLIERGELEPREPMLCEDALAQGIYWPKPWSEWCQKECQYGANEPCIACLKNDQNKDKSCYLDNRKISWQADINCQFYKDCAVECGSKESLDTECYECLCGRFANEEYPDEVCTDWLCFGKDNFVCCH